MDRQEATAEYRRLLKELVDHTRQMQSEGLAIPWVYDSDFDVRIEPKSTYHDSDQAEHIL